MKTINIAIVDDQALVGIGFSQIISNLFNFNVLFIADSYYDLLEKINLSDVLPDIVMMDILLKDADGIDIATIIKNKYNNIKILLFSSYTEETYIQRAVEAGVNGYINKCDNIDNLKLAIDDIYKNGFYFNKNYNMDIIRKYVQDGKSGASKPNRIELSKREKEILKLICESYTDSEIASKLSLTTYTVATYKRELMKKLDIRKSTGLVLYAVKNKLFKL